MLSQLSQAVANNSLATCMRQNGLKTCSQEQLDKLRSFSLKGKAEETYYWMTTMSGHKHEIENVHFSETLHAFKPMLDKEKQAV